MIVVRGKHINTKIVSFPSWYKETLPAPQDTSIKYPPI
jgi:hypothetical protein